MTPNKFWWQVYRGRREQPNVRNMSREMVFRRVFTQTVREYLSVCSIGGINAIFRKNICLLKRITAIVIFTLLFSCIFYFLRYTWFDNLAKPFIVTMETTNYPIRNIDFPTIILCNFNRISKRALNSFVKKSYRAIATKNESMEEVTLFLRHLGRLIDHTYHPHLTLNPLLLSFAKYLGDTYNITKIMRQLAPSCKDMILRCTWSAELVDCDSIFKVYRTARGHCCAFNAVFDDSDSWQVSIDILTWTIGHSLFDLEPLHSNLQQWLLALDPANMNNNNTMKLQQQISPGQFYGLNVILDPMKHDYEYALQNMHGFEALIFNAALIGDPTVGGVKQLILQPGNKFYFEVQSTKQVATSEVKKYSKETRNCFFHNEPLKKSNHFYSYSSCIVNCRKATIQTLCNCIPYYLTSLPEQGPVCTLDNLKCLSKYKEKVYNLYPFDTNDIAGLESEIQNSLYCPDCYPDCETIQYTTKYSIVPYRRFGTDRKQFLSRFVTGLNMSNLCMLSVYQATASGVLNRLDVVLYWFEVLSNVGGYCGVLVGLSIISAVELLYFFVFKFVYNYVNIFS